MDKKRKGRRVYERQRVVGECQGTSLECVYVVKAKDGERRNSRRKNEKGEREGVEDCPGKNGKRARFGPAPPLGSGGGP